MNKDEFAIYNNKTVQELRFKDPRKLTLDEAEDVNSSFFQNPQVSDLRVLRDTEKVAGKNGR